MCVGSCVARASTRRLKVKRRKIYSLEHAPKMRDHWKRVGAKTTYAICENEEIRQKGQF